MLTPEQRLLVELGPLHREHAALDVLVRHILAVYAGVEQDLRRAQREKKELLAACRHLGFHVAAGGTLRLPDSVGVWVLAERGARIVFEDGGRPDRIEVVS